MRPVDASKSAASSIHVLGVEAPSAAGSQRRAVQKSAMSVAAFQKEAERMNMTEDMMGDMLSEAFDDDEEETDAVVGQVLAEVGLDTTKNLQDAPTAALPEPEAAEADDTDQLLRQLNAL